MKTNGVSKLILTLQVAIALLASCTEKSVGQADTTIYFKGWDQCQGCSDCFYIPNIIETDTAYAKLLSAYFMHSLQIVDSCGEISSEVERRKLYKRDSFVDAVTSVYLNGIEMEAPFSETYFIDRRMELLFYINDSDALHKVADTLLYHNNQDGLMAIWDNLDTTKLDHLGKYYNEVLSSDNIFAVAGVIVSMHLNGYNEKEEKLLARAKELSNGFEEEYTALRELLAQPSFDYVEYIGKVYYGN